jgi:hypothetical protein
MIQSAGQLSLELGGRESPGPAAHSPTRQERRVRRVRMVEYSAYPRVAPDQRTRLGSTCDLSASGMCLGVDRAETEGALLRVILRGVDGRPTYDMLTQVVWCRAQPGGGGRFRLGLRRVAEARRQLLRVRHLHRSEQVHLCA